MSSTKHNPNGSITPGHVRAFQAVTSRMYDNITLWSCRIDGEPGVAIVMVDDAGEGRLAVMPLFVAITETMDITFDGEGRNGGDGGGGGPKTPGEQFEAGKPGVTAPAPR